MGHLVGKDLYHQLGEKIDGLTTRVPWNNKLYAILKELYTPDEAAFIASMPYGLTDLENISAVTKQDQDKIKKLLDGLCAKGLVMDLWLKDKYYYTPSPMVIGIFEFTMMRTRGELNTKEWAKLFHAYLMEDETFVKANNGNGELVSFMRTLPHEETIVQDAHLEILDYERAAELIDRENKFSIGICSCRHEKHHLNTKQCEVPLETCSSFGYAAEYMVRNNLARKVSKTEMMDNLTRSKELGLVLNADNVQKNITFICHCCGCCCNALAGISKFGYPNAIVTSNYIPENDLDTCKGCGKCAKACAINGITMLEVDAPQNKKKKQPLINKSICLGCGVCGLKCPTGAMKLVKRKKRVICPETTFEKVLLASLEKGTLQNQLFENPNSISQKFMRGLLGGFLRLSPVKKALMTDTLRSRFLKTMKYGATLQGKGWLTEI